jgi:hypothetical protein
MDRLEAPAIRLGNCDAPVVTAAGTVTGQIDSHTFNTSGQIRGVQRGQIDATVIIFCSNVVS